MVKKNRPHRYPRPTEQRPFLRREKTLLPEKSGRQPEKFLPCLAFAH
jgi:hypothetical protein